MTLISPDVNSISDLYIYVYILDVSSLECNFKYFHDDAMTHNFKKRGSPSSLVKVHRTHLSHHPLSRSFKSFINAHL